MQERVAKHPTETVRWWARHLSNSAAAQHISRTRPVSDHLIRLAALLTLVGTKEDEKALAAYYSFQALFMKPKRVLKWPQAIQQIPPTREAVLRIEACASAFQQKYNSSGRRSLQDGLYKLDEVIRVMVLVPTAQAKAYVTHLERQALLYPGAVFHINTFNNTAKTMRGLKDAAEVRMQADHSAQVRSKVQVIE